MEKLSPPDVYIKDTGTRRGRGVFAARRFSNGEIVEVSPVVIVPIPRKHTQLNSRATTLHPAPGVTVEVSFVQEFKVLVFAWGHLAKVPGTSAVALGYGSLYNSANPANMRYEADGCNSALRFVAVRDIQTDEELTINYNADGGGAQWKDQNWFVLMDIKPEPGSFGAAKDIQSLIKQPLDEPSPQSARTLSRTSFRAISSDHFRFMRYDHEGIPRWVLRTLGSVLLLTLIYWALTL